MSNARPFIILLLLATVLGCGEGSSSFTVHYRNDQILGGLEIAITDGEMSVTSLSEGWYEEHPLCHKVKAPICFTMLQQALVTSERSLSEFEEASLRRAIDESGLLGLPEVCHGEPEWLSTYPSIEISVMLGEKSLAVECKAPRDSDLEPPAVKQVREAVECLAKTWPFGMTPIEGCD